MDTYESNKPNPKRRRADDDSLLPKLAECHQSNAVHQSPIKITDLYDDCLAKCFEYLDLRSLFNVSVANEWLRPAANDVYKRKFGRKMVQITSTRQ